MDTRLRKVVQWTVYVVIVFIAFVTIASLVINLIAPTFFPQANISGFESYLNTAAMILSFLSAGLGIVSIWQATSSNKQVMDILNGIHDIEKKQDLISKDIISMSMINIQQANASTQAIWKPDHDDA